MSKISVIMPTYNRAQYIGKTLESVLMQTYQDFEIIVVNDGSIDSTNEIVDAYIKRYPDKIRYFYQQNKGPGAARNRGIKEAKGELVAFLDTDDLWHPQKLMLQVEYLEKHPQISLVSTEFEYIDNSGKLLGYSNRRRKIPTDGMVLKYVFEHSTLMTSSILVRKSVFDNVGLFDETLRTAEDTDMYLRIAKHFKIGLIEKYLTKRRNLNTGLTKSQFILRRDNRVKVFTRFLQNNREFVENNKGAVKRVLSNIYFDNAEEALAINSFKEAMNNMKNYFKYRVSIRAFFLCFKIALMNLLGIRIVDYIRTIKGKC